MARLLVVDGNDDFLDGVVDWVADNRQFEIVGRAHTGSEAIERVASLRPDVVLMDVTLPDMNGFDAARRIKALEPSPLVVLLSFHDTRAARLEAWAAGADGFVAKPDTTTRLMPLVVELLRNRRMKNGNEDSVFSKRRMPSTDLTE